MTCMDLTNPFFKLIANVMQEEALKKGFQLVALSGDQDPAKQNNQIIEPVPNSTPPPVVNWTYYKTSKI